MKKVQQIINQIKLAKEVDEKKDLLNILKKELANIEAQVVADIGTIGTIGTVGNVDDFEMQLFKEVNGDGEVAVKPMPVIKETVVEVTAIEVKKSNYELEFINFDKDKVYNNICFTGHRPDKIGGYDRNNLVRKEVKQYIYKIVKKLIGNGSKKFVTGGALGLDQDAFDVCQYLRDTEKAEIKLGVYVPFEGFDGRWQKESKQYFAGQLTKADGKKVIVDPAPKDYKGVAIALQQRNIAMVDAVSLVIAYFDGTTGGTKNCVEYAKKKGKAIIVIKPVK